jgi:hypothetical protein
MGMNTNSQYVHSQKVTFYTAVNVAYINTISRFNYSAHTQKLKKSVRGFCIFFNSPRLSQKISDFDFESIEVLVLFAFLQSILPSYASRSRSRENREHYKQINDQKIQKIITQK